MSGSVPGTCNPEMPWLTGLINNARWDRTHRVLITRRILQPDDFEGLLLRHTGSDADLFFSERPQLLKLAVRERPINAVAILCVQADVVLKLAQ